MRFELARKLAFILAFIIPPLIPIALIWNWLSPVGFVQNIIMFGVSCVLYFIFLIGWILVMLILRD